MLIRFLSIPFVRKPLRSACHAAFFTCLVWISVAGVLAAHQETYTGSPSTDEELTRPATWQVVSLERVSLWANQLLETSELNNAAREAIARLERNVEFQVDPLDAVREILMAAYPSVAPILAATRQPLAPHLAAQQIAAAPLWDESLLPKIARDQALLIVGRWLAQNDLYDEALSTMEPLTIDDVIDPATLLFYRGLSQHRLLLKSDCLESLQTLMENDSQIPRRFAVVSRLMLADIEPLEVDSLDEIARLMDDVRRRQQLFRSGTRVLGREQQLIEKLDRLIEELEQQLQQSQQASAGQSSPSNPMPDSQNAGGRGAGNVDNQRLPDGGSWGDLPPRQRAAALTEMAKDLPPHYREVIEEYFRLLAKEPRR